MPVETSRKRSVRRIYAPGTTKGDKDALFIPLKITDEITFKEESGGQEWVLKFDNTGESSREVHSVYVGKDQTTGKNLPKDEQITVERIDNMETKEPVGGIEAIWAFLGNKENPPVHLETYKKKIYLSDESGKIVDKNVWIEVQRIKSIEFTDEKDEVTGQEYVWELKHPDEEDEQDDYTDTKDAVTKWDFTDINPPYRIDPFQEIVDCSWSSLCMMVLGDKDTVIAIPMSDVYRGKYNSTYKKKLPQFDLGDYVVVCAQEQIADGVSVICSDYDLTGTRPEYVYGSMTLVCKDAKASLKKSIQINPALNWIIFNGSGAPDNFKIYKAEAKFSYTKRDGFKQDSFAPDQDTTAISKDGDYYKSQSERTSAHYVVTYPLMDTKTGTGSRPRVDLPSKIEKEYREEYTDVEFHWTFLSVAGDTGPLGGTCSDWAMPYFVETPQTITRQKSAASFGDESLGNIDVVQTGNNPPQKRWIGTSIETHGPYSLDVNFGFDIGWVIGWAVSSGGQRTTHWSGVGDPPPDGTETYEVGHNTNIFNGAQNADNLVTTRFDQVVIDPNGKANWIQGYNENFCGVHHISSERSYMGRTVDGAPVLEDVGALSDAVPYKFPYAVSGKAYWKREDISGGEATITFVTPYKRFEMPPGMNAIFNGWMNLHNGAVLVQGFEIKKLVGGGQNESSRYLYINGKEVKSLGGIKVEDISAVFIDIPLSKITSYK